MRAIVEKQRNRKQQSMHAHTQDQSKAEEEEEVVHRLIFELIARRARNERKRTSASIGRAGVWEYAWTAWQCRCRRTVLLLLLLVFVVVFQIFLSYYFFLYSLFPHFILLLSIGWGQIGGLIVRVCIFISISIFLFESMRRWRLRREERLKRGRKRESRVKAKLRLGCAKRYSGAGSGE